VRIAPSHADELLRDGYTVVPGFLTEAELKAARGNMLRYFPTPQELAATPERYAVLLEDPEHLQVEFPFAGDALNFNSTHPEIIAFVEQLLGTRQVMLSQSAVWAKYAGTGDFSQEMHLDYEGNTLVVPRDDGAFRQVNMILYYTDVDEAMGPTCLVPQGRARHLPVWPPWPGRDKHPELYELERPVLAKAGSLLLFSMRTFHRASDMTAEAGVRLSHHMVWRAAGHDYQGYHQWSRFGEKPQLARFIERATPRQREAIGFPPSGHAYWNEETVAAVALRYPRMDMTPYQRA
jgi:ectoine hydroxylase-related dioxygenase (phytanoyl-CoA dioxygenase family)